MTTIMKYNRNIIRFLTAFMALSLMACHDDDNTLSNTNEEDANYVGKAVGNFSADEWYPGGKLGTTDNVAAGCYEDETPAVENQGLMKEFKLGEASFEIGQPGLDSGALAGLAPRGLFGQPGPALGGPLPQLRHLPRRPVLYRHLHF